MLKSLIKALNDKNDTEWANSRRYSVKYLFAKWYLLLYVNVLRSLNTISTHEYYCIKPNCCLHAPITCRAMNIIYVGCEAIFNTYTAYSIVCKKITLRPIYTGKGKSSVTFSSPNYCLSLFSVTISCFQRLLECAWQYILRCTWARSRVKPALSDHCWYRVTKSLNTEVTLLESHLVAF